jgi:hypothetical protein
MTRLLEALRLLLGAVMVVTAVQYFMPFLLPFVPAAEWNDPMAQRLMTAFDRSGLLAVARFITSSPERCCCPTAPCRSRSRR